MPLAPILGATLAAWLPALVGVAVGVGWIAWAMRGGGDATRAEREVRTAGPGRAARLRFVAGLALAAAAWLIADSVVLGAAVLVAWQAGSRLLGTRRRDREFRAEEAHALAAIATATRALRAGIPLAGVVGILANDAKGESGTAFREIQQREAMGEELPSAIRRVLLKSRLAALRAFGLALLMQLKAGGNIANTTDRLARSLVERNRVRRRARTIVAYGRAAAILLGLLPLAIVPVLSINMDGYADLLLDRPVGNALLAASAMLIAGGLLVVQRMCAIDRVGEGSLR